MKRRGITLLELLIAIALTAIVAASLVGSLKVALNFGPNLRANADSYEKQVAIENRLRNLLSHAWINTSTTDQTTFFTTNPQQPTTTTTGTTTGTTTTGSNQGTQSSSNGAPGGGADTLVFTALGLPVSGNELYNDDDFETNNQKHEPTGGTIEVGLSMNAVGNAQGQTGVFVRIQSPADTDPTQGGKESLLVSGVDSLSFEFWDGSGWETTWDTPNMTTKRIPSAVRVTYSTNGKDQHCFIVILPNSDITPSNPLSGTSTSQGGGA